MIAFLSTIPERVPDFFMGFVGGVMTVVGAFLYAEWRQSRPHPVHFPKDYRVICDCMKMEDGA